ncbi:MAG: hypothetical protein AB8G18_15595 [Gammaproteobacteria bacterium]
MSEMIDGAVRRFIDDSAASIIFEEATMQAPTSIDDVRVRKVELVVRCQELSRFLRSFDETNWAEWLDDCVAAIRQNSVAGSDVLLEGFGGIGSIINVYLCPEAGHKVDPRDEAAINEQFLLMLSKVGNLAREFGS